MIRLFDYDRIVVNSSAGKDSQAMLDLIAQQALTEGVLDRVVVAHADLAQCEWPGVKELAERQADHYGVRFEVVKRKSGTILDHVLRRGRWPDSSCRWCTSDHKRTPIQTLFTKLAKEVKKVAPRILNCLGMRADESPARAKLVQLEVGARGSSSNRQVDRYLPMHDQSACQVWQRIRVSGAPHHQAYDLGMPRLSCCFCIFAPRSALMLAATHNRELLDEYVAVERKTGHQFRGAPGSPNGVSLESIARAVDDGEAASEVSDWKM